MKELRVGVVGASGYSGGVATRIVAGHPRLALAFATSDKLAGEGISARLGVPAIDAALRFVPNGEALDRAEACDAVLLATAADVSLRLAPAFAERGKQVVDLSGAFRLEASAYPRWYGFEHTAPVWLERAHYGLPELFGAPPGRAPGPASGAIVANPGCYPTAALLAIAPLVRAGLVEPDGIVVDAKSGVTGAGRRSDEAHSFAEVDGDLRAYKVLTHQHTPEIARGLARVTPDAGRRAAAGAPRSGPTFTAHLLPITRGLLATCYARPLPGATAAAVAACLAETYARTPFVRAVGPDEVMLKRVVGTNLALVGATLGDGVVIAIGAIDNLLKGAAGQAVQNLNGLNGWDEALGLEALQRFAP
jgi:N-acetyl-gamma-glutamyl-phosphate reductase